jgi:hypothetical protein
LLRGRVADAVALGSRRTAAAARGSKRKTPTHNLWGGTQPTTHNGASYSNMVCAMLHVHQTSYSHSAHTTRMHRGSADNYTRLDTPGPCVTQRATPHEVRSIRGSSGRSAIQLGLLAHPAWVTPPACVSPTDLTDDAGTLFQRLDRTRSPCDRTEHLRVWFRAAWARCPHHDRTGWRSTAAVSRQPSPFIEGDERECPRVANRAAHVPELLPQPLLRAPPPSSVWSRLP